MFLTVHKGILRPIAQFLGLCLNGIFFLLSKIGIPNVGLSIIILTIIIYMCLLPLTIKQQKFSKLSAKMQPELKKIQDKYKGRTDPESAQRMQEESSAVYKKYGVSPTGSCVQLLIQMPILFALYRVFYNIPAYITQVKQAYFPLVTDLIKLDPKGKYLQSFKAAATFTKQFSDKSTTMSNNFIDVLNKFSQSDWDKLAKHFPKLADDISTTTARLFHYNNFLGVNLGLSPQSTFHSYWSSGSKVLALTALIIPLLAAFTQWLNTALMPTAPSSGDPTQDQTASMMKSMNITMPIISAWFTFTLPSGLGLYWIAGAVVRCVQQVFINRHIDRMDFDAIIARNEEKAKQKAIAKGEQEQSSKVKQYSSMRTRSLSPEQESKYSTKLSAEQEKKLEQDRAARKSKTYKKGSMAEKVNMVSSFNERSTTPTGSQQNSAADTAESAGSKKGGKRSSRKK